MRRVAQALIEWHGLFVGVRHELAVPATLRLGLHSLHQDPTEPEAALPLQYGHPLGPARATEIEVPTTDRSVAGAGWPSKAGARRRRSARKERLHARA